MSCFLTRDLQRPEDSMMAFLSEARGSRNCAWRSLYSAIWSTMNKGGIQTSFGKQTLRNFSLVKSTLQDVYNKSPWSWNERILKIVQSHTKSNEL